MGRDPAREVGVGGAGRIEVGPHRQHHQRAPVRRRGRVHQRRHERVPGGLVAAQGEGLLELVDDPHHPGLRGSVRERPGRRQVQRPRVGRELVEGLADRHVAAHVGGPRGEGVERPRARPQELDREGLAAGQDARAQRRHQAGPDERRLPAARAAEHRQERGRLELLDEPLGVGLASEEELGVAFVEALQAAVRRRVVAARDGLGGAERDALDRVDQRLQGPLVGDPGAQVDPGAGAQERRQDGGVERLGQAGEQHQEHPVARVLGRDVERHRELLVLPGADVRRADEHGAGLRLVQALGQLLLPAPARRQAPDVEPRLEPGPLQVLREPLDGWLVARVVRQEDVEASRCGGDGHAVADAMPPTSRMQREQATRRRRRARRGPAPTRSGCGRCAWPRTARGRRPGRAPSRRRRPRRAARRRRSR